jgi:hypothetical protein
VSPQPPVGESGPARERATAGDPFPAASEQPAGDAGPAPGTGTGGEAGPGAGEQPGDSGRRLIDDLVDYGVYAPLGAAIRVVESLPDLMEKGRNRLESRVATARLVGRFAVTEARRRVERAFTPPSEPAPPAETATPPAAERREPAVIVELAPAAASSERRHVDRAAPTGAAPERTVGASADAVPAVEDLAIPNYDSLAASQVVPRLASLSGSELEAIRRYESARRRRRTVLSRIAQLQGSAAGAPG